MSALRRRSPNPAGSSDQQPGDLAVSWNRSEDTPPHASQRGSSLAPSALPSSLLLNPARPNHNLLVSSSSALSLDLTGSSQSSGLTSTNGSSSIEAGYHREGASRDVDFEQIKRAGGRSTDLSAAVTESAADLELGRLLAALSPREFERRPQSSGSDNNSTPNTQRVNIYMNGRVAMDRVKVNRGDLSGLGMSEIFDEEDDPVDRNGQAERAAKSTSPSSTRTILANSRSLREQVRARGSSQPDQTINPALTSASRPVRTMDPSATGHGSGNNISAWMNLTSAYLPWNKRNKPDVRSRNPASRIAAVETDHESAPATPNPFASPTSSGHPTSSASRRIEQGGIIEGAGPSIRLVRSSTAGTSEGGETLFRSGSRSAGMALDSELDTEIDTDAEATPRVRPSHANANLTITDRGGSALTPRTYLPDSPYVYPAHITASYGYASLNTAYTPTLPSLPMMHKPSATGSLAPPSLQQQPQQLRQDSMAYRASKHRLTHRQSPLPPELKTIERSPRHVLSGSPIVGLDGVASDNDDMGSQASSYWGADHLASRAEIKFTGKGRKPFGKGLLEDMLREEYEWRAKSSHPDEGKREETLKTRRSTLREKLLPTRPLVPRAPTSPVMARDASKESTSTTTSSETLVDSKSTTEKDDLDSTHKMQRDGTASSFASKGSLPMPDFVRKSSLLRRLRGGGQTISAPATTEKAGVNPGNAAKAIISAPTSVPQQPRPTILDRLAGYASPALPPAFRFPRKPDPYTPLRPRSNLQLKFTRKVPQLRGIYRTKQKWGALKWILLISVLSVFGYGLLLVIWSIRLWCRTIPLSDITVVFDSDVITYVTIAGFFCLFNALVGLTGAILNSRPILAAYAILLWPCLLSLCFIGYTSYKRETLQLDLKLNQAWSQMLDDEQRLRIQQALNCCGFFNPFHDASYSRSCYPRTALPGCKGNWLRFERESLRIFSTVAFSIIPVHLVNIVASLICSNHVNHLADVQANVAAAVVTAPEPAVKSNAA